MTCDDCGQPAPLCLGTRYYCSACAQKRIDAFINRGSTLTAARAESTTTLTRRERWLMMFAYAAGAHGEWSPDGIDKWLASEGRDGETIEQSLANDAPRTNP